MNETKESLSGITQWEIEKALKILEKEAPHELAYEMFEWKSLEYISYSLHKIRSSHPVRNIWELENWKKLLQDTENILQKKYPIEFLYSDKNYWNIRNLKNQAFLFSHPTVFPPTAATFSPGWSYGPYYLGKLALLEKKWEYPNIMIGASAWALYPVLYELYRMAKNEDLDNCVREFPGLTGLIPENLEWKSMLQNGTNLIESFSKIWQKLINIINKERKNSHTQLLPDIQNIHFSDLVSAVGVIASRQMKSGFQEVLFSWDDTIMDAVTASSNPLLKIWPISMNVLHRTEFYGNNWNDGDHTNPMPIEWLYNFPTKNITQITSMRIHTGEIDKMFDYDKVYDTDLFREKNPLFEKYKWDVFMTDLMWQWSWFEKEKAQIYIFLGTIDFQNPDSILDWLSILKNLSLDSSLQKKVWITVFMRMLSSINTWEDRHNIGTYLQIINLSQWIIPIDIYKSFWKHLLSKNMVYIYSSKDWKDFLSFYQKCILDENHISEYLFILTKVYPKSEWQDVIDWIRDKKIGNLIKTNFKEWFYSELTVTVSDSTEKYVFQTIQDMFEYPPSNIYNSDFESIDSQSFKNIFQQFCFLRNEWEFQKIIQGLPNFLHEMSNEWLTAALEKLALLLYNLQSIFMDRYNQGFLSVEVLSYFSRFVNIFLSDQGFNRISFFKEFMGIPFKENNKTLNDFIQKQTL